MIRYRGGDNSADGVTGQRSISVEEDSLHIVRMSNHLFQLFPASGVPDSNDLTGGQGGCVIRGELKKKRKEDRTTFSGDPDTRVEASALSARL